PFSLHRPAEGPIQVQGRCREQARNRRLVGILEDGHRSLEEVSPMHRSLRTALPIALAMALALPVTASYADEPAAPRTSARTTSDEPLLRHAAGGRAAIRALGDDLDEAARRSRMSTAELREVLSTDSSARIFPNGRLAYVD